MRLFAPATQTHYVFATAPGEPALVIDRRTAEVRLAPPDELQDLVGAANQRARNIEVKGVIGLLTFPDDRSLVVVTEVAARSVAAERGPATAHVIVKTAFLPLRQSFASASAEKAGSANGQWVPPGMQEAAAASGSSAGTDSAAAIGGKQRTHLKDFLEAGDCFLATAASGYEFTHTLQRRAARGGSATWTRTLADADARFVWNALALEPLAAAGPGPWLTAVMQASVVTEVVTLPGGGVLTASLVSRRSCEHAGTRFKTRGVDDSGAAANCVESEQILHLQVG